MFARFRIAAALAVAVLVIGSTPVFAVAPDNDDIGQPIVVGLLPYSNSQDTTEATTGPTDPDCAGNGPTVWYAFTPVDAGWYAIDTFGSDYDTTLSLGTPDGAGGINLLACVDDSGGSVQSRIAYEADAGITYLAMIGSFASGSGGSLVLNVDATTAPIPLELTVTVDPTGRFLSDGRAIIGGTVSCNQPAFGYATLDLSQRVGRFTIRGWTDVGFDCTTEGGRWEAIVSGNGKFAGGHASLHLYALAFGSDKEQFAETEITTTLRLTR